MQNFISDLLQCVLMFLIHFDSGNKPTQFTNERLSALTHTTPYTSCVFGRLSQENLSICLRAPNNTQHALFARQSPAASGHCGKH